MSALHTLFAGAHSPRQIELHVRFGLTAARDPSLRLLDRELAQELPALARHARRVHEENELLRAKSDRCGRCDVFEREIEDFSSRRIAHWRKQHELVVGEALSN